MQKPSKPGMSYNEVGKNYHDSGPLQNVKSFQERNLKFDFTFSDIGNRKSLSVLSEAYRLHSNDSSHKLNITFRHCSTLPIESVPVKQFGRFQSNMCDLITRFLQNTSGNMMGLHTEFLHIWGAITTTTHDPKYGPFFCFSLTRKSAVASVRNEGVSMKPICTLLSNNVGYYSRLFFTDFR